VGEHNKILEKDLGEVKEAVETLLGQVRNLSNDVTELRRQLALLQQQFYAKGTTSYADNSGLDK
jgi:hypothetical protein